MAFNKETGRIDIDPLTVLEDIRAKADSVWPLTPAQMRILKALDFGVMSEVDAKRALLDTLIK